MDRKKRCKNCPRAGRSRVSSVSVSNSRKASSADKCGGLGSPGGGIKNTVGAPDCPEGERVWRTPALVSMHGDCHQLDAAWLMPIFPKILILQGQNPFYIF